MMVIDPTLTLTNLLESDAGSSLKDALVREMRGAYAIYGTEAKLAIYAPPWFVNTIAAIEQALGTDEPLLLGLPLLSSRHLPDDRRIEPAWEHRIYVSCAPCAREAEE